MDETNLSVLGVQRALPHSRNSNHRVTVTSNPADADRAAGFLYALRNHYRAYGIVPNDLVPPTGTFIGKKNVLLEFDGREYPLTDGNLSVLARPWRILDYAKSSKTPLPKGRGIAVPTLPAHCTLAHCRIYCSVLDRAAFNDTLAKRAAPVALWVLGSLIPLGGHRA